MKVVLSHPLLADSRAIEVSSMDMGAVVDLVTDISPGILTIKYKDGSVSSHPVTLKEAGERGWLVL